MKRIFADSILLAVTFAWGATFVVVQDAIRVFPVFNFLGLRFTLSGLIMIACVIIVPKFRQQLYNKRLWLTGAWLGLWLFAGYALQTVGLLYTTPAQSGFITGLSVVLVPALSLVILHHKPSMGVWLGVVCAAIGLFFLSYQPHRGFNVGDILTFFCAVAFAVQIVAVGKYAERFSPLALAAVQILVVGILSLISAFFAGTASSTFGPGWMQPSVWEGLVICILFATILAYFAQMVIQKYTTPTRTALIFSAEPVFAALTAYLFASDKIGLSGLIGCALILAGMLIAEFAAKDREATAKLSQSSLLDKVP